MKRVLVTGGRGQLGTELGRLRWPEGWAAVCVDSRDADLRDPVAAAKLVSDGDWAAVISAGAYTAVDRAESDQATAWSVNALAPAALAEACRQAATPIVQLSTDYVFDGTAPGARRPGDATNPLSVYGASKLGGELAVRASGARHAVVRTSWVFSAQGTNFVRTMLRVAAERETISVVDDQHGAPTSAADLANAVATIARALADGAPSGAWHVTGAGETTWRGFAEAIMAGSRARGGPSATILPIATADYPTPARRPMSSLLDTGDAVRDFAIAPRLWPGALEEVLDVLIGPGL